NETKHHVPGDIKLIGFSNWFMSQVISPKLSTVDQPSEEMGITAFNLLLEEMNAKREGIDIQPKTIELSTSIIARESTAN
ncbi:MAG: hypothetical protein RIT03_1567, partial [Bacteroidota bacterium]